MSFSIAEDELRQIGVELTAGHYCSWNYFQSIDTPANRRFVREFRKDTAPTVSRTTRSRLPIFRSICLRRLLKRQAAPTLTRSARGAWPDLRGTWRAHTNRPSKSTHLEGFPDRKDSTGRTIQNRLEQRRPVASASLPAGHFSRHSRQTGQDHVPQHQHHDRSGNRGTGGR